MAGMYSKISRSVPPVAIGGGASRISRYDDADPFTGNTAQAVSSLHGAPVRQPRAPADSNAAIALIRYKGGLTRSLADCTLAGGTFRSLIQIAAGTPVPPGRLFRAAAQAMIKLESHTDLRAIARLAQLTLERRSVRLPGVLEKIQAASSLEQLRDAGKWLGGTDSRAQLSMEQGAGLQLAVHIKRSDVLAALVAQAEAGIRHDGLESLGQFKNALYRIVADCAIHALCEGLQNCMVNFFVPRRYIAADASMEDPHARTGHAGGPHPALSSDLHMALAAIHGRLDDFTDTLASSDVNPFVDCIEAMYAEEDKLFENFGVKEPKRLKPWLADSPLVPLMRHILHGAPLPTGCVPYKCTTRENFVASLTTASGERFQFPNGVIAAVHQDLAGADYRGLLDSLQSAFSSSHALAQPDPEADARKRAFDFDSQGKQYRFVYQTGAVVRSHKQAGTTEYTRLTNAEVRTFGAQRCSQTVVVRVMPGTRES